MKKALALLVALTLALSLLAGTALAEPTTYTQAPMLDALVEAGDIPPLEERLPDNP